MAKKNKEKKIAVKRPKIGEVYEFMFAGGKEIGKLARVDEKLSQHYNEEWFIFFVPKGMGGHSRDMWYPAAISSITRKVEGINITIVPKAEKN